MHWLPAAKMTQTTLTAAFMFLFYEKIVAVTMKLVRLRQASLK